MVHTVENIQLDEKVNKQNIKNEVKSRNYLIKSGRYYALTQMNNRATALSRIRKR
jgi:hypothetical protein